ncbi:TolC family protein [Seonamhaeicola aphaedonensis]|uniref:Outer membrane protein n=1 Tax=Seonamhaeicola aphaedonensis TaxID=1461338 RepID=A0A3D9HI93_9FLAO|nr:TolC family protein [Seonamhaeicola aphaedonensis]RED48676.1 outer membrane protein [Seonamhaeicola aphaedonensis]
MKSVFLIGLLLLSVLSFSQQKKWTLQECVEYAMEHNISVQQSGLDVEQAEINKKDAFGNFLPSLNASGNHSWNIGLNQNITTGLLENLTTQFTSFGLNSNIDIYRGLRNINSLHRSNLAILASQYQLDRMKDDTALAIANAYLQILFNREQLKVLNGQNQLTKENLKQTQELINAGVIPQGDILELQATDANQEQQIISAQNNLFLSKLNLAQLLQLNDYQYFDVEIISYDLITEDILEQSPSVIAERAKQELNNIKIAQANLELAEYDVKLAKGALLPTLLGFYSYSTRASYSDQVSGFELDSNNPTSVIGTVEGTNQNVLAPNFRSIIGGPDPLFDQFARNDGHNFGLQLNVPIFNGFVSKNNVERNKVNLERSKFQLEQANLDLEAAVYQAYNDAKNAKQAFDAATKTANAREQAFKYINDRYVLGVTNSFDFNQSKIQFENAQAEVVRTKYDYIFRLKILEFYFGIPITQ